jgi:uncharacterized protein (DUF1800 family)
MPYLDQNTTVLTASSAAHLLRRTTAGPTKAEIASFTGKTPLQAYIDLLTAVNYNPTPPIGTFANKPDYQQPFINAVFDGDLNFDRSTYIKRWWIQQIVRQDTPPSLLEKLALFWQNHFVTTREIVSDFRYIWRYLMLIRNNSLGNFRSFVIAITKDPAMLVYLNGHENENGTPNENYARELQELFTVGVRDFAGNPNYTEDDVKEAARALTGWKHQNFWNNGTSTIGSSFNASKHDTGNKIFSHYYNNTTITGRSGSTAGDLELTDLTNMLLAHPETPKFICRKLYKWYVNPEVTQDIENNVIIPLADFFKSTANNWQIEPVLRKLLTSDIFYDTANVGAIIKSPYEFVFGSLRFLNLPVPNPATDTNGYDKYTHYTDWNTVGLQMNILDQTSVFGYEPYFQSNLSKAWIASSTVAQRNSFTDQYIWKWLEINPNYKLGPDLVEWAKTLQPNFLTPVTPFSPATTDCIPATAIMEAFTNHLFVSGLYQVQKDFLVDTIMMRGIPRTSWLFEWNAFRVVSNNPSDPTYQDKYNTILWRLNLIMRYLLRMAEFHVF